MRKNEAKLPQVKGKSYDALGIELKWQSKWNKEGVYQPDLDSASLGSGGDTSHKISIIKNHKAASKREKIGTPFYNLMMFPYPSAEGLHVGSIYTFGGVDVYGRFKRMQGHQVFEPIGLDGFGIHSENHAIKTNTHPIDHAKRTEENFYRQLHVIGNGYAWDNKVETYNPDYYRWTQWIFVQLFKSNLAYRKKSPVNFCPSCKTVLSDEQVIDGACERCGSVVEKRELEQWFFRITEFTKRLLDNIERLNWSEKVRVAQRNWIGKKEGMLIKHTVIGKDLEFQTFTAYPVWSWADTFIVIAPEHPFVKDLVKGTKFEKQVNDFIKETEEISNKDRVEDKFEKKGVFTGQYAKDPFGGPDMPIWLANFALMDFGTGIIRCSSHDPRDYEFAQKYGIALKEVVKREGNTPVNAHGNKGVLLDSGPFTGRKVEDILEPVKEWIEKEGIGKREVSYHLRDWLISRQRYWGPPIPMIYCDACAKEGKSWFTTEEAGKAAKKSSIEEMKGWYPEENLPVELPHIKNFKPLGTGKAPLANYPEFYETTCPECGSKARRETDVSDTFLDSAWYFLRYLATDLKHVPFPMNAKKAKEFKGVTKEEIAHAEKRQAWLPVTSYIGGAEHSVLHLLYARFITMALHDMGYLSFEEPFARFYAHGLIIKDGAKMSKSKGNIINPDDYINKYGADTLRTYLRFLGPFDQGGDFRDSGIEGMHRFLKRVWSLFQKDGISNFQFPISNARLKMMHQTIKDVTEEMEHLRFNTAIAKLMTWYNFLVKEKKVSKEEAEVYLKLLAPFAPHMTEEVWEKLGHTTSIHISSWPTYESKYLVQESLTVAVQVNGKLRGTVVIPASEKDDKEIVEQKAREQDSVKKFLEGEIRKVIYVPGKIINFVV